MEWIINQLKYSYEILDFWTFAVVPISYAVFRMWAIMFNDKSGIKIFMSIIVMMFIMWTISIPLWWTVVEWLDDSMFFAPVRRIYNFIVRLSDKTENTTIFILYIGAALAALGGISQVIRLARGLYIIDNNKPKQEEEQSSQEDIEWISINIANNLFGLDIQIYKHGCSRAIKHKDLQVLKQLEMQLLLLCDRPTIRKEDNYG